MVPELDLTTMLNHLFPLVIAFILAFPIAWDREQSVKTMGMRTFPLVAMGSCAFLLLGAEVANGDANALARVLEGVLTGVGFLGGGAIVKEGLTVRGAATAAAIWTTAAIGASVAYGYYEIAILLAIISFGVLRWMKPVEEIADERATDRNGDQPAAGRR